MQKALMIDIEKCTGCKRCETACSFFKEQECNPTKSRIHVISWSKEILDIPFYCVQCLDPACKAVCPVGAIKADKDSGVVSVDSDSCIGCRMCMIACPVGAISIDPN